jgi:hypothetical protein
MMPPHDIHPGKLQDVALADLLRNLLSSKATGILTLQHNGQEKSIYLKDGNIVFASSNLLEDRLGNILVHAGKLTQEQAEAVLKLRGATHKKFGAIIVELGFLTPKELFDGLKLQVKEIIYSLFRWEDGAYRFMAGELPSQTIPLILDPIQLISEIIIRLKENPGGGT